MVSIAAFQAVDPGLVPGRRTTSVGVNSVACLASRDSPVPLDQDLSAHLSHWLDMAILNRPVSMHPPTPVVVLMTDASLFDRSCLLLPHRVEDSWGQEVVAFSMNWRDLGAFLLFLLHFS